MNGRAAPASGARRTDPLVRAAVAVVRGAATRAPPVGGDVAGAEAEAAMLDADACTAALVLAAGPSGAIAVLGGGAVTTAVSDAAGTSPARGAGPRLATPRVATDTSTPPATVPTRSATTVSQPREREGGAVATGAATTA